jgi:Tfp pilus assembly protein PilF
MIADLQPRFVPDEDWGSFAYRRSAAVSEEREARTSRPQSEHFRETPLRFRPEHQESGLPRALDSAPTSPEEILDEARRLADRKQYAVALRLCEQLVRNQVQSASVYSLLGMISLATGESDKAEANLLKAVYLDDADVEALLALALICQGRGDAAAAARYRRRAERARLREKAK